MDLVHAIVLHQAFGQGEITQQNGEMICVSFSDPHGEKKFVFPGAFQGHLTLMDDALLSQMNALLLEKNQRETAAQVRADRSERIAKFCADQAAEKAVRAKAVSKKRK